MELLQQLDTRTLAFVTGLGGFLMALAMLGIHFAGMRNRALLYWGLAGLCYGLGHQLGHLLLTVDIDLPREVALTTANGFICLGHVFGLVGVQAYLGRRSWLPGLLVVVVALSLVSLNWDEMRDSLRMRVILLSSFYLALDCVAGLMLWRARSGALTAYHRMAASVLLVNSMFLAVRLVYAAGTQALTTSFVQDPFQVLFFLVSMVFVFALALALALVMFRGKEVELQRLVHHDPLTGLFNRRSLFEHAARESARCERYNTALSLVVLDIDHFKQVNDRRGHAAGDDVIRHVVERLVQNLRDSDSAFRLGGEEFLVLMPSTDLEAARAAADRLRAALASSTVEGQRVTASFGVTQMARGEEDWEMALGRADQAMYQAKRDGRNRVVAIAPPVGRDAARPVPADESA